MHVRLELFNMRGQRVAVLVDNFKTAGIHSVDLDTASLTSGTYICRLSTAQAALSRKTVLVR
jgi:hypothetical protein